MVQSIFFNRLAFVLGILFRQGILQPSSAFPVTTSRKNVKNLYSPENGMHADLQLMIQKKEGRQFLGDASSYFISGFFRDMNA